jgi:hypothetical protein
MTLVWMIVWFIANNVGGHAPLTFDPVNVWTGTLLLAIALDLGRQHVPNGPPPRRAPRGPGPPPPAP